MNNLFQNQDSGRGERQKRATFILITACVIAMMFFMFVFMNIIYSFDIFGGTEIHVLFTDDVSEDELRDVIVLNDTKMTSIRTLDSTSEFVMRFDSWWTSSVEEELGVVLKQTYGLNNFEIISAVSFDSDIEGQFWRIFLFGTISILLIIFLTMFFASRIKKME